MGKGKRGEPLSPATVSQWNYTPSHEAQALLQVRLVAPGARQRRPLDPGPVFDQGGRAQGRKRSRGGPPADRYARRGLEEDDHLGAGRHSPSGASSAAQPAARAGASKGAAKPTLSCHLRPVTVRVLASAPKGAEAARLASTRTPRTRSSREPGGPARPPSRCRAWRAATPRPARSSAS